jgi:PAS domain S-box-containing protein
MIFDELIYDLPGHVYWLDRSLIFRGANNQSAHSFGLASSADLIGRSLSDFVSPEVFQSILENNNKVIESGKAQSFVERCEFPYGWTSMLSNKAPIFNSDREIIGVLGISFDFTAEKNLEGQRQKMFESLIGLMPGYVYWRNEKSEFLGCNDLQAQIAGFSKEEMIGKTDWEMPWASVAERMRQDDLEVMRNKQALTVEESAIIQGAHRIFLSNKVPFLDGEDNVIGVLGVSFDITEQRRLEELKLQMRIANERADSMKVMASSIAHELRTPLSAIHSAMGWVNEEMPKLLEAYEIAKAAGLDVPAIHPRRIKLFDRISADVSHEAESANNIINMLLVKLGQTNISPEDLEDCSITECINEALMRYPFPTEEHRTLVHWNPGSKSKFNNSFDSDFKFRGTSLLLNHVVFNLLKNALHFIDEAGKGEIFISLKQEEVENMLIFRDTAKGISEKDLSSIFEKFFSKTLHGSGIGLAFCKQVMHSFGGTISCHSIENEFAEFVLRFPKIRDGG